MEQRLIDANKLTREEILHLWYHLPNGDIACPKIDIDHASTVLTLPDNPTNGDIQKSLHPNASVHIDEVAGIVFFEGDYDEFELRCSLDWWNAPFQQR